MGGLPVDDFGKGTASGTGEDLGTIVDELGVGVGGTQEQAVRELAVHAELPGVIDGVASVVANNHRAKVGIETCDAVRTEVAGTIAGVELLVDEEMLAAGAHVCGREDESTGKLALNIDVPLMGHRIVQIAGDGFNSDERISNTRDS